MIERHETKLASHNISGSLVISRRHAKTGATAAERRVLLHHCGLLQTTVNSLGLSGRKQPWTGSCGLALARCHVSAQDGSSGARSQGSARPSLQPASPQRRHGPWRAWLRWSDAMLYELSFPLPFSVLRDFFFFFFKSVS